MKKRVSWLFAVMAATVLSMTQAGLGVDYSFSTEEYPSHAVLSSAFPSNAGYEWSKDFSNRPGAANDWLVSNISAGAANHYGGFSAVPGGGFGVTHEQTYTAIVASNWGTALDAWAEAARQYADHDYPIYTDQADVLSRNTLWEKIRYTLDGVAFVPDPAPNTDPALGGISFLRGTSYLYNLNTVTGVGFTSAVDSAFLNASAFANQILRKRLVDARSSTNDACGYGFGVRPDRFWASPFFTDHKENEKEGYAPFRYKAVGLALGYDRDFGPFTLGGAAFHSGGEYTDGWAPRGGENKSQHYGLSVYGNWRVTERLFVDAHAGYQHSRNDMRRELIGASTGTRYNNNTALRHVPAATNAVGDWLGAESSTGTWWLAAKAGYDFIPWRNVVVTPSIGLEYRRTGNHGFLVRDSVGVPFMEMGRMTRSGFFVPLDLAVQYRRAVREELIMTLRAGGGYTHDFSDEGTTGSMRYAGMNRTVAIRGRTPDAENWNVNLGAKFDFRDRWEFGADYRYEGAGRHGYTGSLAIKF